MELPYSEEHLSSEPAVEFMAGKARELDGQLEIVALGPLTDLAQLSQQDPEAFSKIKAIYSMGGTFGAGNITPYCEFNYYYDREAVRIVLEAVEKYQVAFHMFPLDITMQIVFDMNEFMMLKLDGGRWGKIVHDIFISSYLPKSWHNSGQMGCVQHDLVAAMYPIAPELYDQPEPVQVTVEMAGEHVGRLHETEQPGHVHIHRHIDPPAFKRKYFRLVFGQKLAERYKQLLANRLP